MIPIKIRIPSYLIILQNHPPAIYFPATNARFDTSNDKIASTSAMFLSPIL